MSGIKNIRQRLGLSRKELGASVGVSEMTVGKWETGIGYPRVATAWRIVHLVQERTLARSAGPILERIYPDPHIGDSV